MIQTESRSDRHVDFHLKEYEFLKKEIEGAVAETRSLERYALVVTGAVWAWLFATNHDPGPEQAWWLPAMFTFFAAGRSVALYFSIRRIGDYIRGNVEKRFFIDEKGWESHLRPDSATPIGSVLKSTAMLFWIALLITTVAAPFTFAPQQRSLASVPVTQPARK